MVRTVGLNNYSDVHYTNSRVASTIVDHYKPKGVVLEPFRGAGAFYDHLPKNSRWCEIEKGLCFFKYKSHVDWIVTNPPYSNLTDVMKHAFSISVNTVLLVPMSKIYSSVPRMNLVRNESGMKEQLIFGSGRSIGFNTGFVFAAIHFERGYKGAVKVSYADKS